MPPTKRRQAAAATSSTSTHTSSPPSSRSSTPKAAADSKTGRTESSSGGFPGKLVGVLAVIVVVGVLVQQLQQPGVASPSSRQQTIRALEWKGPAARIAARERLPTLFHHTPADAWKARLWTLDDLPSKFGEVELPAVHIFNSTGRPFVYYDPEKPLTEHLVLPPPPVRIESMTMPQIVDIVHGAESRAYFSAEFARFNSDRSVNVSNSALLDGCNSIGALTLEPSASAAIWVGSAGVVAHTHYDVSKCR